MIRFRFSVLFSWALSLGLMLSSCSSYHLEEATEGQEQADLCEVIVNLTGLDLITDANWAPASRATASEAGLTNITLNIIDSQNQVAFSITQASTDEDFGTISAKIPVGNYTFVAVANGAAESPAVINSATEATISGMMPIAIYSASQQVSITGHTNLSQRHVLLCIVVRHFHLRQPRLRKYIHLS